MPDTLSCVVGNFSLPCSILIILIHLQRRMCEARMVMSNWHIQYRYKVINWPKPQTPEDVLKFIGFVGYHR